MATPPKKPISALTDMAELRRLLTNEGTASQRRQVNRQELADHLSSHVRGQDEAIRQIASAVFAGYAKQKRSRPVATFLFVGPPGVGKTETAKALSGHLFGSDKDMLVLNGAEYQHADEGVMKLVGAGPAYKGSEQGGTLTRPMFGKKERVVLFDEIEKMNPRCYDVLLSLLQDGYVIEGGSNKRADFTSAVVLMTSNLDHDKCAQIAQSVTEIEARTAAYKEHFNARGFARPEILDRIPDIVYFKPLDVEVLAEVVVQKIQALAAEYGIVLEHVEPIAAYRLLDAVLKGQGGIRAIMQIAERRLGPDFAELSSQRVASAVVAWREDRLQALPGTAAAPTQIQSAATVPSAAPTRPI
jgi:ATP-dependent Clp protease ATP-binding subunit ClpB